MADSVLIHTYPNLSPTPHSEETALERGIRWPTNLFQKTLTLLCPISQNIYDLISEILW